jgi:exopolyphosphatase/guanosine-5'-triphosphate,3'-diphosphate pyrophosphatase
VKIISEILKYYDKNLKRLYSRSNLTKENKLIVSKLILIIKIANGLIINKKNRVKDVIVELENNQLTLKVITDEKIYNEKLEIELQKENFENTFGIKLSMKEINN